MKLNSKKTTSMVISQSRTYAPGYGDLTLGGAKFKDVKSLRIFRVTLDSKLTFESNLGQFVSKAAKSLGVMLVFLKSCFNVYVCPAWSIMPPYRCRLQIFIWVY